MGNATYGAGVRTDLLFRKDPADNSQILFHSIEKDYFLTNLPWLIGSLGTMAEDAIIFAQFHAFGDKSSTAAVE